MNDDSERKRSWKRAGTLALWLFLMLPVGLWKLYRDPTLSTSTKWRILIYLFVFPTLLYFTISVWLTNSALQKFAP